MKIAVFHNLPSGGAKRSLYNLVKQLVNMGHCADLYIPSTANENYLGMGSLVSKCYPYVVRGTLGSKIGSVLRLPPDVHPVQKAIAKDINARDYDVVLCEQDQYVQSPYLLRYLEKPTVYYCQQPVRSGESILLKLNSMAEAVNPSRFYRRLWRAWRRPWVAGIDRKNASFASYIVANSYFSREAILRSYGQNAAVSYLGTDTEFFRPMSMPREAFILSVGSCCASKGFDFLIRSLGLVEPRLRVPLRIISNASQPGWEPYLRQLAAGLGVSLEIRKGVSDMELLDHYNRARIFVYSPYLEPFGLAPLEAMACGTPVLAVKEGGVRESVLDGVTGILTDRAEAAFADALCTLLCDDNARNALGKNGSEAARDFWAWERAGERLQGHLERASRLNTRSIAAVGASVLPESHSVPLETS